MANGTDYSAAYSSTGFWGSLLGGLFAPTPTYAALPTRPNPSSQVLVSRNSGWVVDPGAPGSDTHPPGYSMADMWYDPIGSNVVERNFVQDRDPNTGRFLTLGGQPIGKMVTESYHKPKFYYVKSDSVEANAEALAGKITNQYDNLFRAPEAAMIGHDPCAPVSPSIAAVAAERINRMSTNQFFSPFRSRRYGGNSYQALSEGVDSLFQINGKPGVFGETYTPDIVQSGRSLRLPRR